MKILIDVTTTQDQFASRGIGRFTKEIVSRMVAQSAAEKRDDTYLLLAFNAPTTLNGLVKEYPDMIRTLNMGKPRLSGKFNLLWWMLLYSPSIRRIIRREKPDVYFCPYLHRGFPSGRIPAIVMVYDFAPQVIGRYSSAHKNLDWIRKTQYHAELKRIRFASGIAVISETTRSDLEKYVPSLDMSKTKTIYLGIPEYLKIRKPRMNVLKKYIPSRVVHRGYILYYGGLEANKNVPMVVKAYRRLLDLWKESGTKLKHPYLVFAGGDFTRLDMRHPVLAEVRNSIRELDLEDDVFFTGFYDDEHVVDLLNAASLFTHLSLYEGFGFSPLEAMRSGVPVVASNRSCYPEVLGDGAVLVDPENVEDIAQAYLKLLTSENASAKQAKKGRKRSLKYDWEKTTKQLYSFMKQSVEAKKK
ncbi:MAG: glycosyltransferase family 1 protein [Candidatus Dojkabacteria bacterium]|nr:glycosyltransferase family 1 protein [Candidatus Dojkabacteria bacterium]